ncbi:MAG: hypothetical protein IT208_12480 [Chthonomonadales bacterium]|nr:hypothetical protein [Chthonomonadales bacterium]
MPPIHARATDFLRGLGSRDALDADARRGPALPSRVNSHIHLPPNFSAFETVAQAVELAAAQGLSVLGVSNYYDYSVYRDFAIRALDCGVFPLFGTEVIALVDDLRRAGVKINDPGNPGKLYLCGKGISRFEEMSPEAARLLGTVRRDDSERMERMAERLDAVLAGAGFRAGLDAEAVRDRVVRRHGSPRETVYLQERHIAQAFQEALFERQSPAERAATLLRAFGAEPGGVDDPVAVQSAIRTHLMKAGRPAFVAETFVGFEHALRLVLELGGIPCYPVLADGAEPICPFEEPVEGLVERLRTWGLHCAELIPVRNRPDVLGRYVRALRRAGLVVTAGTEHNTLDLLPMEPTCLGGEPIPEDLRAVFREGACVVAAHQFRLAQGLPGFVDAAGSPDPGYASDEERIRAYARLGAAVVRRGLDAAVA